MGAFLHPMQKKAVKIPGTSSIFQNKIKKNYIWIFVVLNSFSKEYWLFFGWALDNIFYEYETLIWCRFIQRNCTDLLEKLGLETYWPGLGPLEHGTGPRVFFWYFFLNFIIHFTTTLSKSQDWPQILIWHFMQLQAYFIFSLKIVFYYWTGPGSLLWGPVLGSTFQCVFSATSSTKPLIQE